MDPELLQRYDRPVPRYTSYPTAAQFSSAVGPAQHAAWLRALPPGDVVTAYLHVPFCRRLCWYCACNTQAMNRAESLDAYAAALEREIDLVARTAPSPVIAAVEWGGGTPTHLGARRLARIGALLNDRFDRLCDAETSMEIDPRWFGEEDAAALREIGVTRASVGVQDFDSDVQRAIGREQSFEDTARAFERLRRAGIAGVNVDLVYGLPGQTLQSLARTLDLALSLAPSRLAVFGYAHVPWMKPHQRLIDAAALPGAAQRLAMTDLVAEATAARGYVRVGLDHYALPGDRLATASADGAVRRSFQGYVAAGAACVVGFGASAISSSPGGFSQNAADAADYMAKIGAGEFATVRGVALDDDDRLRGDIIAGLMCALRVDLGDRCRRRGADPRRFRAEIVRLGPMADEGLVRLDGWKVEVTERGRPFVRSVCAVFDRHHAPREGRHARGV